MKQSRTGKYIAAGLVMAAVMAACGDARRDRPQENADGKTRPITADSPGTITIDYPREGTIFPPEFPAPVWLWRDENNKAVSWEITISFPDGSPSIRLASTGERMSIGEIDPACVSSSNKPPKLTKKQAAAHSWRPDEPLWTAIKKHSTGHPATVTITGRRRDDSKTIVSRGKGSILTSTDSVGAPIFYRDVPLMPSESKKGVIKPLDKNLVPLIAWRLRNVAEKQSKVVMQGLHTCANCHSFSADGKTLGMDMDGPENDKGLYTITNVSPQMSIRPEDQISWSTFRGKLGSKLRVGFMSQISPDARHVVTMINDPGVDQTDYERNRKPIDIEQAYYVTNFKDYRFLQVFFPTRGILAWYSSETAHLQYLPGADDTNYVHTNAVWSPDGKYLVFARARARDANPAGAAEAQYANDPKEMQIKYDLYRIPFNNGKGGKAEPIAGASQNGMSNSFPKISPDGRWIVFVQAQNGLLMRPDGKLYMVPAEGGVARQMNCNTPLMNSWHSFSPNGRWMVFSSKSQSPYTQMFLTHIDESGNDSPPILIENATAANRAVNLPEFVNIPADGIKKIDVPAAEYARHTDLAIESMKKGQYDTAVLEWNKAMALAPDDYNSHNNLGVALMETGQTDEAIKHYRRALELNPQYVEACNNLGEALAGKGKDEEAIEQFSRAVRLDSAFITARMNLGLTLARTGQTDNAIFHLKKVAQATPDAAEIRRSLGHALAQKGRFEEARVELEAAVKLSKSMDPLALFLLGRVNADLGDIPQAVQIERLALALALQLKRMPLAQAIRAHLDVLAQPH